MELPPSSFFLTDPLLMLLMLYAGWAILRPHSGILTRRVHALAIAGGLAAPWLLMLCALSMNFRYRMDFYPLIEFGAFLGFMMLCRNSWAAMAPRSLRVAAVVSMGFGVAASHVILVLYRVSHFGSPVALLCQGVFAYYVQQILEFFPFLTRWIGS
jgi:hypothetical protein